MAPAATSRRGSRIRPAITPAMMAPVDVPGDGQRDRRYEQDEADDQEQQDEGDPDPDREPELYEPEQQAPSDVVAEETVAAPDGAEDALPAHHDVPQGVLADYGEGDKDDDEQEDGQKPHHHRDGDPRPRGLGGRERAPDQERHGNS